MAMATMSGSPCVIDGSRVSALLSYPLLMEHLRVSFREADSIAAPPRHHHHLPNSGSTLLIMPAWPINPNPSRIKPFMGVKLVTVFPENASIGLRSVSASYMLSCAKTGMPLACIDGTELTLRRTACVSALAADCLAKKDVGTLLMVGAGALAPHLIRAHCAARPSINKVLIWNRTHAKATALAQDLRARDMAKQAVSFEAGADLEPLVKLADVVSCATMSDQALVQGAWLLPGTHLDLVGSFTPSMRECDEDALVRSCGVFVDSEAALEEAGELASLSPHNMGIVRGTLSQLVAGERVGRQSADDITVFKAVGSALADLATAQYIYEQQRHCT